ncbi:MAG: DUF2752 domain-containing protein [Marmoricola sp.]
MDVPTTPNVTQPPEVSDVPGPRERSRLERLRAPLVTGGVVAGLTLALHVRDPHASGSWGFCPWYALTGAYCPGCGGLRAVNDLTNGDLVGAAGSNLLFVAAIPFLVLWWLRWTRQAWTGAPPDAAGTRRSGVWIAVFVVVVVVFGVLRNLPAGSWLAPCGASQRSPGQFVFM